MKIFMNIGNVKVKALYDTKTNKVTVLKGSIMKIDSKAQAIEQRIKIIRDAIINDRNITNNGKFLKDFEFSSPSRAAKVLLGSSNSGNQTFTTEDGKLLKEIRNPSSTEFIEYIIDNIEDYKEVGIDADKEREEFRKRYPLESLKELKLESYDTRGKKDSFMNMIEHYTNSLGSGFLGYNKNKIFAHKSRDEYEVKAKISQYEENIGLSIQEIFKKFMNECYEFIKNFDIENYNSLNDYAGKKYLHESNMIKSKLISIYCGDSPIITTINSKIIAGEIVEFLNMPHNADEDTIDLNIKITKYILENAPELRKYSLAQISFVIWDYYEKYIKSENRYYYVGTYIDDENKKDEFINNNMIAIGWENVGNLRDYNNDDEILNKAREVFSEKDAKHFKRVLNIFKEMRKGDKVVLKTCFTRGKNHKICTLRIFAIGEILNDFDEGYDFIPGLGHILPVKWLNIFEPAKEFDITAMKALQQIKGEELKLIKSIENGGNGVVSIDTKKEIKGENIIYYGVPGCGKSREVKRITSSYKKCERILFHPDYTYSDFVGQIQPILVEDETTGKKTVVYDFVPGPFTEILGEALNDKEENYCLIIEEINRGNAPAIFGDIFQLLDRLSKDDEQGYKKGDSEYRIKNAEITKYFESEETLNIDNTQEIYIPNNLSIIATMNSSDQNVFPLDTAFKRRWKFKRISNEFEDTHSYAGNPIDGTEITWRQFVEKINGEIKKENINNINGEDKQIGKYFATQEEVNDKEMFAEKVIFYLWEDVVKLNPQVLFNTQDYESLDDVVQGFKDKGIAIFKEGIFDGDNSNEE